MVYRTHDQQFTAMQRKNNGKRLVREAIADGKHDVAWQHVKAYGLNALDTHGLGLSDAHRPRGFKLPSIPKAMGLAR